MPTSTTFRGILPLSLVLFAFVLVFCVNDGYSAEPHTSDPFSGKYSTIYPFGEERNFNCLSELFHFLKDPKGSAKTPKKDEFESDSDFAKRRHAFEAKMEAAREQEKTFVIEFRVILGNYSHVLQGFPINLSIFDYKANVFDAENDFEANPKTSTYRIQGGNVLLSDSWEVDPKKSLYMRAHTGNLSRNIRFRNDAVPLIVHVSDLDAAKRLRNNESKLIARIEGRLVDSRQDYVIVSGRISKSEGWSRSGGTYVARFESLGRHKIDITKFVVRIGLDEYNVVTIKKAKNIVKKFGGTRKRLRFPFIAYKKYEKSYCSGYNTSNRETFFDTGQKRFKDREGDVHIWRIHAENYAFKRNNYHYSAPKVFFECDGKNVEKKWRSSSESIDIGPIRFIQAEEGKFKYFFMYRLDRGIENLPVEVSEPANLFDIMGK